MVEGEIGADAERDSVTTLELFFDLVFVFTVTQLTHLLLHDMSWLGLAQTALILGLIWWMYSGFAWLTNEVAPTSTIRRTMLFCGMAAFLVIALAIPQAFGSSGVAFGVGYLAIITIHLTVIVVSGGQGAVSVMRKIGPFNIGSAVLVVAGGFIDGWPRYALWLLALVTQIASPYLQRIDEFQVRAAHFAERHGLVIIVALGESVVAIGAGLAGEEIGVGLVAAVLLALTLCYVLWWAYFGFDQERAANSLAKLPGPLRAWASLTAYGYAHYPILLGIVVMAAGIRDTIHSEERAASLPAALALSGGVALVFIGLGAFRAAMGLPRPGWRFAGVIVLATVPVGVGWVSWAQLVIMLVVLFALVIADDLIALRRWHFLRR